MLATVKPTVRQIIAKYPLPMPRREDAASGGDFRDMAFREVRPIHIMYHCKIVRMRAVSGIGVRSYDGNPASEITNSFCPGNTCSQVR
jgi:hypothetical protein